MRSVTTAQMNHEKKTSHAMKIPVNAQDFMGFPDDFRDDGIIPT